MVSSVAQQSNPTYRSPQEYFSILTPKTLEFIHALGSTSTVVSGSRASAYFYPTACTDESDWDLYCSSGYIGVTRFMYLLEQIGAVWHGAPRDIDLTVGYGSGFSIVQGKLNENVLQIIWANNVPAFRHIVEFHSSIVQCFISGFCAVSMYHNVSRKGKLIPWHIGLGDGTFISRMKASKAPGCVQKYIERGFSEEIYSRKLVGAGQTFLEQLSTLGLKPGTYPRVRRVSDSGSLVVDFIKWIEYDNEIDRSIHHLSVEEIVKLGWMETPCRPASPDNRSKADTNPTLITNQYRLPADSELVRLRQLLPRPYIRLPDSRFPQLTPTILGIPTYNTETKEVTPVDVTGIGIIMSNALSLGTDPMDYVARELVEENARSPPV
jgi:hypothetical protein